MPSVYNRLPRKIAVIGHRTAYIHLCEHCGVDPHNNDLFCRVDTPEDALNQEFIRVIEIEGAKETHDYNIIKSLAMMRIKNETTASAN